MPDDANPVVKPRQSEDGWFRVSSHEGSQFTFWQIFFTGLASWLCALILGGFWSSAWYGVVAPDSGPGQDITAVFVIVSFVFTSLYVLTFGSIFMLVGLKAGEIGYLWVLVGLVVVYTLLPIAIYTEIHESGRIGLLWGLHSGTNYGVISALVFWKILIVNHPELVPDSGEHTSALQLLIAVGVFILGQFASGIGMVFLL